MSFELLGRFRRSPDCEERLRGHPGRSSFVRNRMWPARLLRSLRWRLPVHSMDQKHYQCRSKSLVLFVILSSLILSSQLLEVLKCFIRNNTLYCTWFSYLLMSIFNAFIDTFSILGFSFIYQVFWNQTHLHFYSFGLLKHEKYLYSLRLIRNITTVEDS